MNKNLAIRVDGRLLVMLGALESPRPSLSVLSSRSASVFLFRAAPGFGAWPRSSRDSRRRLPVSNTVARQLAGGWVRAG